MVEPSELLEDLGMIGIVSQDLLIGLLRLGILLLLLIHVSYLEPDINFGERFRRVVDNVIEALEQKSANLKRSRGIAMRATCTDLERLGVFVLLLVYYSESKIDLIRFVEGRVHSHDLAEGLLGVLETPISIVQDTDAVPKLRLLRVL